jgi:ribosome biogenesis GTPase / thiamine phosphate phosphatase
MDLKVWGWDEDWESRWRDRAYSKDVVPARVLQEHRDRWVVASGGEEQAATCHAADVRPAVGDWVAVREGGPQGTVLIIDSLPRRTSFTRGAAGRANREQVVAANVDTVWIVHGLDAPVNPRRLERYLTLGWESGARPVIVLTKTDLADGILELEQTVASIAIGVPVRAVTTVQRESLTVLSPDLTPGSTVALLGPSGAGKSTLVNALLDRSVFKTGSVRSGDHKGRHTTTWRQLVRLESGALLLDTPGMRELQLWDVDEGIDRTFSDIAELGAGCRYSDCVHDSEPGCAVKEAVERGTLDVGRLQSYRKLLAESAYQQRRADVRLRQAEVARIKTIQKSFRDHVKYKHQ